MKAPSIFTEFQPGDGTIYTVLFEKLDDAQYLFGFTAGNDRSIPTRILNAKDISDRWDAADFFGDQSLSEYTISALPLVWLFLTGQDLYERRHDKSTLHVHTTWTESTLAEPWQVQLRDAFPAAFAQEGD